MSRRPLIGLLFASVFCWAATDAAKIMEAVEKQDTSSDATLKAVFDVFDASGHKVQKKFAVLRLGSAGASKTIVRFSDPVELRGVALLSVNVRGEAPKQWIYTPATQRVRSVQPREQAERFAGTDFSYEDIEERVNGNFTYALLSESETMDGRKAYKIQATPLDAGRSQYKSIYYWVAQDVPVILYGEMYGANGAKVRMMHASGFKKVSGFWGARRVEMRTVATGTRTVLTIDDAKFERGLDAALFTPEALRSER